MDEEDGFDFKCFSNKGEDAAHLAAINEVLDASVANVPTISAMGMQ